MAKISAKKLIEKLHEIGGCGAEPDTWANGWDQAIDRAIDIVDGMAHEAKVKKMKKKKRKQKKVPVIKLQDTIVTELCPHCDTEVGISWDVDKDGFEVFCPNCGEPLMLCSACRDREGICDWNDDKQECSRNRELTNCDKCVFCVEVGDGESLHYECRHPDADYVGIINAIGNCELFEPNA